MRVLRVAHHAPVSAWRERERALIRLGIDVRLVSAHRWNEGGRDVELALEGDGFVVGARTLWRHPNVFLYDPRVLWRLLGESWDLIDLHEEPCSLAVAQIRLLAWLRGQRAPYVLYSAQNIHKRYPIPFRWFERAALRGAAGAYVCNGEAGEILARKGLLGPHPTIPLGVDTELLRATERSEPRNHPSVGYVGRLASHKGVDVLLRSAAMRPEWRVEIVGDGPDRLTLAELAESLGITERVRFHGHLGQAEVAQRLRGLDVLVVPSLPTPGWLEQFCRVAVEAMASGVPVVASRSGALPDVVGGAGVLVDPGDPEALANGVGEVLENWQELRARGLDRASRFTWSRVAQQHADLYRAVVPVTEPLKQPEVVVVAYGSPDMLVDCLEALGDEFPLTVVDNSSLPRTREIVESRGGRYLDPGRNLGFGSAVNVALRDLAERGLAEEDVLLLNPDVRIGPDAVRAVQGVAHAGPRIACAGATQADPATGRPARVLWPFASPAGAWIEALGLGRLRRQRHFVIGSVLLLRADALAEIGGFDERYFLYSEEADWQKRARELGWDIAVAQVEATHVGAGTGGDPRRRERHFHAALERFIRKHYGPSGWRVFCAGMIVGSAVRGVVRRGTAGAAARRRLRLYLTGPARAELQDRVAALGGAA